jgi:hypothetical protein
MSSLLQDAGQRWIAEAIVPRRALQSDYFASSFQFIVETQLLVSAVWRVRGGGGADRNCARIHYRILIPPKLPCPLTPKLHTDQKFHKVSGGLQQSLRFQSVRQKSLERGVRYYQCFRLYTIAHWYDDSIINWKGFGRKLLWPNWSPVPTLTREELRPVSPGLADVPTERAPSESEWRTIPLSKLNVMWNRWIWSECHGTFCYDLQPKGTAERAV